MEICPCISLQNDGEAIAEVKKIQIPDYDYWQWIELERSNNICV